jgi:hypothetical protein
MPKDILIEIGGIKKLQSGYSGEFSIVQEKIEFFFRSQNLLISPEGYLDAPVEYDAPNVGSLNKAGTVHCGFLDSGSFPFHREVFNLGFPKGFTIGYNFLRGPNPGTGRLPDIIVDYPYHPDIDAITTEVLDTSNNAYPYDIHTYIGGILRWNHPDIVSGFNRGSLPNYFINRFPLTTKFRSIRPKNSPYLFMLDTADRAAFSSMGYPHWMGNTSEIPYSFNMPLQFTAYFPHFSYIIDESKVIGTNINNKNFTKKYIPIVDPQLVTDNTKYAYIQRERFISGDPNANLYRLLIRVSDGASDGLSVFNSNRIILATLISRSTGEIYQFFTYSLDSTRLLLIVDQNQTGANYQENKDLDLLLKGLNAYFFSDGDESPDTAWGLRAGAYYTAEKFDLFLTYPINLWRSAFRLVTTYKNRYIYVSNYRWYPVGAYAVTDKTYDPALNLIRLTSPQLWSNSELGDYVLIYNPDYITPTSDSFTNNSIWKGKIFPPDLLHRQNIGFPNYNRSLRGSIHKITNKSTSTFDTVILDMAEAGALQSWGDNAWLTPGYYPWAIYQAKTNYSFPSPTEMYAWVIRPIKGRNILYFAGFPGSLDMPPDLNSPFFVNSSNFVDFDFVGEDITAIEGTNDALYVIFPNHIYAIIGTPPVDISLTGLNVDFQLRQISSSLGGECATQLNEIVYIGGKKGFYAISGENIKPIDTDIRNHPDYSKLINSFRYDAFTYNHELIVFLCHYSAYETFMLIYDTLTNNWTFIDRKSRYSNIELGTQYYWSPTGSNTSYIAWKSKSGPYIEVPNYRGYSLLTTPYAKIGAILSRRITGETAWIKGAWKSFFEDGIVMDAYAETHPILIPNYTDIKIRRMYSNYIFPMVKNVQFARMYGSTWYAFQNFYNNFFETVFISTDSGVGGYFQGRCITRTSLINNNYRNPVIFELFSHSGPSLHAKQLKFILQPLFPYIEKYSIHLRLTERKR